MKLIWLQRKYIKRIENNYLSLIQHELNKMQQLKCRIKQLKTIIALLYKIRSQYTIIIFEQVSFFRNAREQKRKLCLHSLTLFQLVILFQIEQTAEK